MKSSLPDTDLNLFLLSSLRCTQDMYVNMVVLAVITSVTIGYICVNEVGLIGNRM